MTGADAFKERAGGRPLKAEALFRKSERREKLQQMFEAAKAAGRGEEFVAMYQDAVARRKAQRLQAYVSDDDVLEELQPLAESSKAYVRQAYPDLRDHEVDIKVDAARATGAGTIGERIEARVREADSERQAARGRQSKRRLRVDASQDPDKVNPLGTGPDGRRPVVATRNKSIAGGAWQALGTSLGFGTPSPKRSRGAEAREQAASRVENRELERLKRDRMQELRKEHGNKSEAELARLGIKIITPEMRRKARDKAEDLATDSTRPLGRFSRRKWAEAVQEARAKGDDLEVERLRRMRKRGRVGKLFSKRTLVLAILFTVIIMPAAVGAASVNAAVGGTLTTVNILFITPSNGIMAATFISLNTVGSIVVQAGNALVGSVYDQMWATALSKVPGAEYARPTFGTVGALIPQLAYFSASVEPVVRDDGSVNYFGNLEGKLLDPDGNVVDTWVYRAAGFENINFQTSIAVCEGEDFCQRMTWSEVWENLKATAKDKWSVSD